MDMTQVILMGSFDAATMAAVTKFQDFYAIAKVMEEDSGYSWRFNHEIIIGKRGDTSRYAEACDCSIILNKQQVAHFPSTNMEINLFIETKGKAVVAPNSPSKFTIPIELNSDGTVTANFEETLKQVLSEIDTSGFLEQFYDMAFEKCISIAKEMQEGNVTLQVKLKEPN